MDTLVAKSGSRVARQLHKDTTSPSPTRLYPPCLISSYLVACFALRRESGIVWLIRQGDWWTENSYRRAEAVTGEASTYR